MNKLYSKWSRVFLIGIFSVLSTGLSLAQVSTYGFNSASGTYTEITGGTVLFSGTADDATSVSTALGFTFNYAGTNYTDIKVNTNGWASFGTASTANVYTPLSSTGTHHPCLAPLGRDLQGQASGEIRIETSGVAPNQVCTIQWKNFRRWGGGQNFNFQIKLYETTNQVQFVYGTMTATGSNTDYDCGLTGASEADFNARTTATDWSATTAAGANTANMALSTTVFPAVGQTYTWAAPPATPPVPTQDAPTVDCVNGTNLIVAGTPDAGVTWYWQSTASGTSTAEPYVGPYNVLTNGTYYLRAFDATFQVWSVNSSSYTVSDVPSATPPPAPIADANPACLSTNITVAAAPGGVEYYWQGTTVDGTSTANPANVPFPVTATGTYTVSAYDTGSQCWSGTVGTAVTINTYIPEAPYVSNDEYVICAGETSHMISAEAPNPWNVSLTSGTLDLPIPDNNAAGVTNGIVVSGVPAGSIPNSLTVTVNISHTWDSDVDIFLTGANGVQIELSTDNGGSGDNYINTVFSLQGGPLITGGTPPFTGTFTPEGDLNLLLSGLINGTWTLQVADDLSGDTGTLHDWSLSMGLSVPPATVNWFDAATGGTQLGSGSSYDAVDDIVMPNPAAGGTYEYYAESFSEECTSTTRTLVTVIVNDVNVIIEPIHVTCNNQASGSFNVTDTLCGVAPFTYSIDGGAFGPLPTDLLPGSYMVEVMDDLGGVSLELPLTINDALAPSMTYMETITDDGGQVSWTANGSETQWYVEWGLPGFTPGTGTEIGSADAMDTFWIITGLDENTNYDVYVSANCGAGQTVGSWDMVNFTTNCSVFTALPFVETFEDDSESRDCWSNQQELGAADWTYQTGSSLGAVTTAYEGTLNARFVSQSPSSGGTPVTKLVSPQFDFTGQDSVALIFAYAQEGWFTDQNITKVYVAGQSSSWTEIQSYNNSVAAWTLDTLFLSDTVFHFAFEGINNWGHANVIDNVQLLPCTLTPGIDGSVDVCRADDTINLNSVITPGESYGKWFFSNPTFIVDDTVAQIGLLPAGTHEFYYIVETPCAIDTTVAYVTVYNASTAGGDGTINVCMNEPFDLYSGLVGLVDHGGTWYDPSNNPMGSSQLMASSIPGQFNYDYIVSNGVCGPDTANVVVNVSPSCDWLNIAELGLEAIELYPNPTSGMIYITNEGSTEVFSYELTDLNGKVIASEMNAINGTNTTSVDLSALEPGVYLIKVANENVEHTFRVIKQ